VLNLKSYLDAVPVNVWNDFARSLLPHRKWDENNILRTSILRDGFDASGRLRDANDNPVYKLDVKVVDFGGASEETLTGADLAVILRLEVNKTLLSRRVVLVQLKRAYFENGKTVFAKLHETSGVRHYGRDFHQAQKMLFFSTAPVYWFATTSGVLEDEASLAAYSQQSNLCSTSFPSSQPCRDVGSHAGAYYGPLAPFPDAIALDSLASMSPGEIEEYLDLCDHFWRPFHGFWRHLRKPTANVLKRSLEYQRDNLPFQLFATLRSRLQQHGFDNFGMPSRIGLFVCNAEDVFALSHSGRSGFVDLYPKSIPFTQFMLQNFLGAGFGDANEKLIDAILAGKVSGYFHERVQEIADAFDFRVPDEIDEGIPVRYSVVVSLQLHTAMEREG